MKEVKKNKKDPTTILLVIIFFVGLCVLLYPTISNFYNTYGVKKALEKYDDTVRSMDTSTIEKMLEDAENYNKELFKNPKGFHDGEVEDEVYGNLLNPLENGMMGYITISKLGVNLPIYHGTPESVLSKSAGHLEGSSLPIGGENTHAIITGHRGLPTAKLFTNLDKLEVSDIFVLNIINQKLTYEVDDIKIVLPEEVDDLEIVEGKDYVTLVTCTPYGINTHRLLIRGHRIENSNLSIVPADAVQINSIVLAPVIAVPILLILLIFVVLNPKGNKKVHLKWSDIKNDKK